MGKKVQKKTFERIKEIYETVPKFRLQFTVLIGGYLAMWAALNGRKDVEKLMLKAFEEQEKAAKSAI